jgi:mycothiol synthase
MTIETVGTLDPVTVDAARDIQRAALEADGTAPFSEATRLSWTAAPRTEGAAADEEDEEAEEEGRHLLARTGAGEPAGYGYLDAHGGAEFAVHPRYRRQGFGRGLLGLLADAAGADDRLRVWSHGDRPEARALAAATGYRVVRELLQLRTALTTDPAPDGVALPTGVTLRAFRPGPDDAAWLRVNARAFAHHPEQGRTTQADLDARKAESWFDPAGFLVAEADGVMVGFHWTKIHPDGRGEIYVLGVDPDRHGGGLGGALSRAGLHHLYQAGAREVLLYVEADNAPALAVYHRAGFTTFARDVMYGR